METLCVTGHRPDGLPWKKQRDNTGRRGDYLAELESVLRLCARNGYRHFISGGAIGVDTDFAFAVLKLKKEFPSITLEVAIPCPEQNRFWTEEERLDYEEILARADKTTVLSAYYTAYCMQKRNKYMVDNSDCLLCCYNGATEGGTYNTIRYAEKTGKKLLFIDLGNNKENGKKETLNYYSRLTNGIS